MWPGFGENVRVLDWMLRRVDGDDVAISSPVGYIPKKEEFHLEGLEGINWEGLFSTPKDFWTEEVSRILANQMDTFLFTEFIFRWLKFNNTLMTISVPISRPLSKRK